MSHYSTLGLSQASFEVSLADLEDAKTKALLDSDSESQKQSILQSFKVLSSSDSRAAHLLELNGVQVNALNSIGDLAFLDQALELREELDEAQGEQETLAVAEQAKVWLESLEAEFARELAAQDFEEALSTQSKLAFMVKFIEDSKKQLDTLDDPDELGLDHLF